MILDKILDKIYYKPLEKYRIKTMLRDLEEDTEKIVNKSDIIDHFRVREAIINHVEHVALQISILCDGKDEYEVFAEKAKLLYSKSHEYKEKINNLK